VEQDVFLGGHAIRLSCKATAECVKCGACIVEGTLTQAVGHPNIDIYLGSSVSHIKKPDRFAVALDVRPEYISPGRCTGCGICLDVCPADNAIIKGYSVHHIPFFALCKENCLYFKDSTCTLCRDECPETAIDLSGKNHRKTVKTDAIIVATGFQAFSPASKPYGYDRFEDVLTSVELEHMLRREGSIRCPSDGRYPEKIAFVQCVGSRDQQLNHLWCSKICCGTALRLAHRIKYDRPDTETTIFYIDIQTFGKDFDSFFKKVKQQVRLIRTIPGDIFLTDDNRLSVTYYDTEPKEECFDLVVLSVGLLPNCDALRPFDSSAMPISEDSAPSMYENRSLPLQRGVFPAGSVLAPMNIEDAVTSAKHAASEVANYLGK